MKNPIQSAGEAVLSRRRALGLLATAATSTVVIAAPAVAAGDSELAALIKRHDVVLDSVRKLWAFVDDTLDNPGNPHVAKVVSSELGWWHRGITSDPVVMHFPGSIDKYIDQRIGQLQWHIDRGITPDAHRKGIERFEADRVRAKALLAERDAAYQAFRVSSGVQAADDKSEALGYELEAMQAEIIAWHCQHLDEAAAKMAFIASNWNQFEQDQIRHALSTLGGNA